MTKTQLMFWMCLGEKLTVTQQWSGVTDSHSQPHWVYHWETTGQYVHPRNWSTRSFLLACTCKIRWERETEREKDPKQERERHRREGTREKGMVRCAGGSSHTWKNHKSMLYQCSNWYAVQKTRASQPNPHTDHTDIDSVICSLNARIGQRE